MNGAGTCAKRASWFTCEGIMPPKIAKPEKRTRPDHLDVGDDNVTDAGLPSVDTSASKAQRLDTGSEPRAGAGTGAGVETGAEVVTPVWSPQPAPPTTPISAPAPPPPSPSASAEVVSVSEAQQRVLDAVERVQGTGQVLEVSFAEDMDRALDPGDGHPQGLVKMVEALQGCAAVCTWMSDRWNTVGVAFMARVSLVEDSACVRRLATFGRQFAVRVVQAMGTSDHEQPADTVWAYLHAVLQYAEGNPATLPEWAISCDLACAVASRANPNPRLKPILKPLTSKHTLSALWHYAHRPKLRYYAQPEQPANEPWTPEDVYTLRIVLALFEEVRGGRSGVFTSLLLHSEYTRPNFGYLSVCLSDPDGKFGPLSCAESLKLALQTPDATQRWAESVLAGGSVDDKGQGASLLEFATKVLSFPRRETW